ncbi:MAG: YihY/virulence factor BrkB family protein [Thermodesulfobacteriota bacterium]
MEPLLRIVRGAVARFGEADCFTRAAAISFFAFFSLIPLLFIVTALLGSVLGKESELLESVVAAARERLPYLGEGVVSNVRGLVENWKAFGWLGLFILAWSAQLVLNALEDSLYSVYGGKDMGWQRGFIVRKLMGMAVLVVVLLTVLVSIGITALGEVVGTLDVGIYGMGVVRYILGSLAFTYMVSFVVMVLATSAVYKFIAVRRMDYRFALYGSCVFTVLWEAAKHLFGWYISNFPIYNKFFGSLGALMVLLIWIFYSANIFLFGASFAISAHRESTGESTGESGGGRPGRVGKGP